MKLVKIIHRIVFKSQRTLYMSVRRYVYIKSSIILIQVAVHPFPHRFVVCWARSQMPAGWILRKTQLCMFNCLV